MYVKVFVLQMYSRFSEFSQLYLLLFLLSLSQIYKEKNVMIIS